MTEMWERYGFYVVQSLLALFLIRHYHLSDIKTYALVGSFTALTYISPILGGMVADRWLGQKKTVLLGAATLFLNYVLMSFSLPLSGLLFALAGVSVGTGMLKPNISSLLGKQYSKKSPHRERGFVIFYMGITTGIILGTVLPPLLQGHFGWGICFISAAIGMLFACLIFSYGIKRLNIENYSDINTLELSNALKAAVAIILMWSVSFSVLLMPSLANSFFAFMAIFAFVLVSKSLTKQTIKERHKTVSLLLLCFISVFFWAFYFQMFLSLTLFITRVVQPTLLGIPFPAPFYVAIQSFGMIALGMLANHFWQKKAKGLVAVNAAKKFVLSMAIMLVAYLVIVASIHLSSAGALISPLILIVTYLLISAAELLLSPVGLAAVTQLAHPKEVSTMMGVFFISLGIGGFLSGKLAQFAAVNHSAAVTLAQLKASYLVAFKTLCFYLFLAFLASVIFASIIYWLNKKLAKHIHFDSPTTKPQKP